MIYESNPSKNNSLLSKAESKIMDLLIKGLSNKSISIHLSISENTVKYHLKNIYKKLNAQSRSEAAYKFNQLIKT